MIAQGTDGTRQPLVGARPLLGREDRIAIAQDAAGDLQAIAPLGALEVQLGVPRPDAQLLAQAQPLGRDPQLVRVEHVGAPPECAAAARPG